MDHLSQRPGQQEHTGQGSSEASKPLAWVTRQVWERSLSQDSDVLTNEEWCLGNCLSEWGKKKKAVYFLHLICRDKLKMD